MDWKTDWTKRARRLGNEKLLLLMVATLFLFIVVGIYIFRSDQSLAEYATTSFDLGQVTTHSRSLSAAPRSLSPQSSPHPLMGSLDDAAAPASAPDVPAASTAPARASGIDAPLSSDERQHEKEFLAAHGAELARYHEKLRRITNRYYKKYPVVRDVDKTFAGMSRYMELKRRYDRDGAPLEFLHGAIALPEVRAEISRRLTDLQAWKASLGMISDSLKDPPPPVIYQEASRFMANPEITNYVSQFSGEVTKNLPTAAAAMTPDMNMTPILKVVQDVSPQSIPGR